MNEVRGYVATWAAWPCNGIGVRPHSFPRTCCLIVSRSCFLGPLGGGFDLVVPLTTIFSESGGSLIVSFTLSFATACSFALNEFGGAIEGEGRLLDVAGLLFEDLDLEGDCFDRDFGELFDFGRILSSEKKSGNENSSSAKAKIPLPLGRGVLVFPLSFLFL